MKIASLFHTIGLLNFNNKQDKEKRRYLTYNRGENLLSFKNTPFHHLNHLEQLVLFHLIENIDRYIPIQDINSIIENESKGCSIYSINRKRETTISMIKQKLGLLLNTPCTNVIFEQKNREDKRLKEIKLNHNYFEILD